MDVGKATLITIDSMNSKTITLGQLIRIMKIDKMDVNKARLITTKHN